MADRGRVLIVEGRFYEEILDQLVEGAMAELDKAGVSYDRVSVPGAFEIPVAIAMAEASNQPYEGYVALGCVIRGETSHYDYICQESARKLMDLAAERALPLGYGILTVENEAQAWMRVRDKNKGGDVAKACLHMMELQGRFLMPIEERGFSP